MELHLLFSSLRHQILLVWCTFLVRFVELQISLMDWCEYSWWSTRDHFDRLHGIFHAECTLSYRLWLDGLVTMHLLFEVERRVIVCDMVFHWAYVRIRLIYLLRYINTDSDVQLRVGCVRPSMPRGSNTVLRQDASCKSLVESAWRVYCAYRGGLATPSHLPNGGLRAFACLSSDGPQDSDLSYTIAMSNLYSAVALRQRVGTRCIDKGWRNKGAFWVQLGPPV
jgi:hypothetical protein